VARVRVHDDHLRIAASVRVGLYRHDAAAKTAAVSEALRSAYLDQADVVSTAYTASVRATVAVLQVLRFKSLP
jgi:hypothetical protein